jgi:DNA-binding transcriptional LysR family regulator
VELRQLRYFVAVAEELHFRRAAERLHLSQPPLSAQIRKLELELGVELFRRSRHGVELTVAGSSLLDDARELLEQAERSVRRTQRAAQGQLGELRVGFVGSAIYAGLPDAVRTFSQERPGVDIQLRELPTEDQLDALRRGHLDVGLVRAPVRTDEIRIEAMLDEPLVVVLPSDHPLAAEPTIELAALANEKLVLFPRGQAPGFHDDVLARLQSRGAEPEVVQEAPETQTIIGLVGAGVGVSIVPASTRALAHPGVVYRPVSDEAYTATLAIVCRRKDASPLVRTFAQVVRDAAPALRDAGA